MQERKPGITYPARQPGTPPSDVSLREPESVFLQTPICVLNEGGLKKRLWKRHQVEGGAYLTARSPHTAPWPLPSLSLLLGLKSVA